MIEIEVKALSAWPVDAWEREWAMKAALARTRWRGIELANEKTAGIKVSVEPGNFTFYFKEYPEPKVCNLDGHPVSVDHHLLQANDDLLFVKSRDNPLSPEEVDERDGALLHALDELSLLAELLGIEGFRHPDDVG